MDGGHLAGIGLAFHLISSDFFGPLTCNLRSFRCFFQPPRGSLASTDAVCICVFGASKWYGIRAHFAVRLSANADGRPPTLCLIGIEPQTVVPECSWSRSRRMCCNKNTPACENHRSGVRWCCLSYERVESAGAGEFSTRRNFAVGLSVQRRGLGRTLTRFCDAHRYACDPPDDGDVPRIADPPGMSMGMRSRNQNQLAAI